MVIVVLPRVHVLVSNGKNILEVEDGGKKRKKCEGKSLILHILLFKAYSFFCESEHPPPRKNAFNCGKSAKEIKRSEMGTGTKRKKERKKKGHECSAIKVEERSEAAKEGNLFRHKQKKSGKEGEKK